MSPGVSECFPRKMWKRRHTSWSFHLEQRRTTKKVGTKIWRTEKGGGVSIFHSSRVRRRSRGRKKENTVHAFGGASIWDIPLLDLSGWEKRKWRNRSNGEEIKRTTRGVQKGCYFVSDDAARNDVRNLRNNFRKRRGGRVKKKIIKGVRYRLMTFRVEFLSSRGARCQHTSTR